MSEYTNPHEFLMALLDSADLPKLPDYLVRTILRKLYYLTEGATGWAVLTDSELLWDIPVSEENLASGLNLLRERKFIVSEPYHGGWKVPVQPGDGQTEYRVSPPETWTNERARTEYWRDLFAFVDNEGNEFRNFDPWRRDVPHKLRFLIFRRDRFTCQYCGRKAPEVVLHCDHKYPSAQGGLTIPWNLVTSCQDCNLGKGVAVV